MNKSKLSIAAASRALLNVFLVIAMVVLASLVGIGGAALWIYGRPEAAQSAARHASPRLKADVASTDTRTFPKLTPIQADTGFPAQLTPAHYVPTDSEIATISDTPRYTYVSYNGGRQQAHLRVLTVLSSTVPAPLTASVADDATPVQVTDRPPLNDSASRYITNASGRVIGIDGTASAAAEDDQQRVLAARAIPTSVMSPEVRVAYPVVTRKALPVDGSELAAEPAAAFDVRSELAREDDRPVLRAQPVARTPHANRPAMFGAADDLRAFGRN